MRNIRVKTLYINHCKKSKFKIENEKNKENAKEEKNKQNIELIVDEANKETDDLAKLIDIDKDLMKEDLVKHEDVNEGVVFIPTISESQPDPIKDENSEDYMEIDKHLSKIFGMSNLENNSEKGDNNNMENDVNSNYDSDVNFEMDDNSISSDDDESLSETLKKRKSKRKPLTRHKTKSEPKHKKPKTEDENEVQLKNTRPRKHFLNPQFWKKITLSEDEAVREFKQREFNNDYYLRAKYKCQNCFKGFSKNEMLVRHLKHWHDEVGHFHFSQN